MKGKTTIALSRENVKDIITEHVMGMVMRPIEVTGIEVHRNGGIDVEFKEAATLPIEPEPSLEP
jgi:hypothetical protein